MKTLFFRDMTVGLDWEAGCIASLTVWGRERRTDRLPLFSVRLRDRSGEAISTDAFDANKCDLTEDGAVYTLFSQPALSQMQVRVWLTDRDGEAEWQIAVDPMNGDLLVEWVEFPSVALPKLSANNKMGDGGTILYPYNEGALVSDMELRERTGFCHQEAEYPSKGSYSVFPNMICSQMLAYLWEDVGLYIGAHDPRRGVKMIDFYQTDNGIGMQIRVFCGVEYGAKYEMDYPVVWSVTGGRWEDAAERYRSWFECSLPVSVKSIAENKGLPQWYEDSPLIVSYPVRGIHDTDEMKPNKLFPYVNALPVLDRIRSETESRLLVLLMHWEGTAPWAPPFVWPPFGGVEAFETFRDALHEKGDLLGVYCSGFGYTKQSRLIEEYNGEEMYRREGLERGMCAGPDNKVAISNICTAQRRGYDICPASEVGRDLLARAYGPLFESGVDYAQILDQNHGGGQYFCYSRDHGHPPAPGAWMTETMQRMLTEWNEQAGKMLFGCESAAAEPFIGNLLFSDNRFELNYKIGCPVPLYAYLYHEYVRNFMGNQVACPFPATADTLRYRMAYSFAAGDCMTLVLTPDGDFMANWGTRDFEHAPSREYTVRMIKNLTRFYRETAKRYLYHGRMIAGERFTCETVSYSIGRYGELDYPALHSTAWEGETGERVQIVVNPSEREAVCRVGDREIRVPALNAVAIRIN